MAISASVHATHIKKAKEHGLAFLASARKNMTDSRLRCQIKLFRVLKCWCRYCGVGEVQAAHLYFVGV